MQIKINNLDNKLVDKQSEMMRVKSVIDEKEQEMTEMNMEIKDLRERYEIETNNRMAE